MEIIDQFIKALDEEIKAIKYERGGRSIKLINGRFLREGAGFFIYIFRLENFLAVLEDSPGEIILAGKNYKAQILAMHGLDLEIGIERFLGEHLAEARLQTDLWYFLELLKKKYMEVKEGQRNPNFSLSQILFGEAKNICQPTTQDNCRYYLSVHPPNEGQKKAIRASFSSQLCVIWGPPGTGKTKTIAHAIEAHLHLGRRVLLVSHANNAVDEALLDVAEELKGTKFYEEGKLLRLGKPQETFLKRFEEKYEMMLLDRISARIGEVLIKERKNLVQERARLDDLIEKYDAFRMALQTEKELTADVRYFEKAIPTTEKQLQGLVRDRDRLQLEKDKRLQQLDRGKTAGFIRRVFGGLNPEKIQKRLDQINQSLSPNQRQVRELTSRLKAQREQLLTKKSSIQKVQVEVKVLLKQMNLTPKEILGKAKKANQQKADIQNRIVTINRKLEEIEKNVLAESKLVATTLTKTYVSKQFPEMPFDVLVLDEASMAPLPHLYWAAGRCTKAITIVGDFLQLPPLGTSQKVMAKKWLKRSIFSVLGIDSVQKARNDPRVTLLDRQYRMVPDISEIPNELFYERELQNDQSTYNRSIEGVISSTPLALIDTKRIKPWSSRLSQGGRFNLYHALVSASVAMRIIDNDKHLSLGIISPYTAQARLINKIVKDWEILEQVRVSTVHRFQGGQEDVIIFDSVEGIGNYIAPMLDDTRDRDARLLLNVAITRAKNKFYFVGNSEYLLRELKEHSALAKFVRHLMKKATILNSETFVDSYFAADFEKYAKEILPSPTVPAETPPGAIFSEKKFWGHFCNDLRVVKRRLIILSPFVTERRCNMLMDYFQALVNSGIEVKIFTRPQTQQSGEMANQFERVAEQYRNMGVKVIERRNMHQKIAIIDDNISWEGSLNILSHRDTEEQMRRFEGISTTEEIFRNLDLDDTFAVGTQTTEKCGEPECNGHLVIRQNRKGKQRFYGCSMYPHCQYTKPFR